MSEYAHVVDKKIRSVLEGDVSEDAICYALTQSRDAVMQDQFNPDVSYETLAAPRGSNRRCRVLLERRRRLGRRARRLAAFLEKLIDNSPSIVYSARATTRKAT